METLYASEFKAPFGTMYMGATRAGICKIGFEKNEFYNWLFDQVDAVEAIERDYYLIKDLKVQLRKYFSGTLKEFDLKLDPRGTRFQQNVWWALSKIPYGTTSTYGEIAAKIESLDASRAVGQACAANPLPIVIPCHRVLGAHESLGGYAGGIEIKEFLLKREGVILL